MNANRSTRDHIVETADQLFYQRGFEHTSFADISNELKISRGNFYHHYKTKDEILDAVIALRIARTERLLEEWESQGQDPEERICSFIHILITNRAKIKLYGCPVGTLCIELAKLNHPSQKDGNKLFTLFRTWLRRQFVLLGRKTDSDELAMHLLARSQGVATLYNTFGSEDFVKREVEQMNQWVKSLKKEFQK